MNLCLQQPGKGMARSNRAAFTLIEILISMVILVTVLSGLIYGYVQANWTAEWCSMSLAAQSFASQGAEEARAADWRPRDWPVTFGYGTMDELTNGFMSSQVSFMDIPTKGNPAATNFQFWVTNYVSVTNMSLNPPLRRIRSDAVWTFPMNGTLCTNTIILMRASDQ
jgi:prepilin-type N-terminal cleavage/methylation domain-containing protein